MEKHRVLKRFLKIIFVVIVFLVIALTNGNGRNVSGVEELFSNIITFPQRAFNYINNKISNNNEFFRDISELQEANKKLIEENLELNKELIDYQILSQTLTSYKQKAEIEGEYTDYKIIIADVISDSTNNWDEIYVINKGSNNGIAPGQIVITKEGLVGRIHSCTSDTAKVISILDAGNVVGGRCTSTRENVTLKGRLSLKDSQELVISNMPYGISFSSRR